MIEPLDHGYETLEHLLRYRNKVLELFPTLPPWCVETWSMGEADALVVSELFDALGSRTVDVLEIGTFVGVGSFVLASQPGVNTVTTVDPNPEVAAEVIDKVNVIGFRDQVRQLDALSGLRVLDVARTTLQTMGGAADRIRIVEGYIGADVSDLVSSPAGKRVMLDEIGLPTAHPLLVFLDGLHTRAAVAADLTEVFRADAGAIVLVDDCRYGWGLEVQAGIADVRKTLPDLRFRLLTDVIPGGVASAFGIVWMPDRDALLDSAFSRYAAHGTWRFDPIQLLAHMVDLTTELEAARHARDNSQREYDEQLSEIIHSRRFRLGKALFRPLDAIRELHSSR